MTTPRKDLLITVGFDGSEPGCAALDWAADEASRRHTSLEVLLASGSAVGPTPGIPMMSPWPDERADALLAEALARVAARAPGLTARGVTSLGGAAGALIEASTTSALVVVGGRRHSKLGELLLGATAPQVAAHAHCPVVVVVPGLPDVGAAAPVVLGVDGSAEGDAACEFAFRRAADTDRPLVAVHTWWLDAPAQLGFSSLSSDVVGRFEEGHRELADDAVATWAAKFPEVQVERLVVRADPVGALRGAARHAALLIVGSRGHGGFAGLMLGSVSQGLLHGQLSCPVVVVHRGDGSRQELRVDASSGRSEW